MVKRSRAAVYSVVNASKTKWLATSVAGGCAVLSCLCFLCCGCNPSFTRQEVADTTGSNRLALVDRRVVSVNDALHRRSGYEFDSLVWRTNNGTAWRNHIVISRSAFQGSSTHRRWVTEIHSFNTTNGTAVIKVAEADVPEGSVDIQYNYSWREWSLLRNREVRLIRNCTTPSEGF